MNNSSTDNPVKNHPEGFHKSDGKYVCPVETTFNILKGRWKINILWALHNNPVMRFGEIHEAIDGISEKVLTKQLRELEKIQFVERKIYSEFPPKVEYYLTDFARTFSPVLANIANWGLENKDKILEIVEQ